MSDSWYREPFSLPPYIDGLGNAWSFTGERLSGIEPPEPQWPEDWPEDWPEELKYLLFQAEVMGALVDQWHKTIDDAVRGDGKPPRGIIAAMRDLDDKP